MEQPLIGQINILCGDIVPYGWLLCDGRALPAGSTYNALYKVIGYDFGRDGGDFRIPDLQGRIPIGAGTGFGLSPRPIGQSGGSENVKLEPAHLPPHTHPAKLHAASATVLTNVANPEHAVLAKDLSMNSQPYTTPEHPFLVEMNSGAVSMVTKEPTSHDNMQPYVVINYIIAWLGEEPVEN